MLQLVKIGWVPACRASYFEAGTFVCTGRWRGNCVVRAACCVTARGLERRNVAGIGLRGRACAGRPWMSIRHCCAFMAAQRLATEGAW